MKRGRMLKYFLQAASFSARSTPHPLSGSHSFFATSTMTTNRKTLASLLVALSLLLPAYDRQAAAAENAAADAVAGKSLIANGNFEADKNADQWPDGWARAKSAIGWQMEDGNHFLRLTSSKPGEMVMLYHAIKLPAGTEALTLRWRMRCSELKPGKQPWYDARILLDVKDADGNKLSGGPSAPYTRKNTAGWVERSISFLVPKGASSLDFMPSLFQVESGTLDLDDVVLTPTDPAPLVAAAKVAAAAAQEKQEKAAISRRAKADAALQREGSLISNGNFEADKKGDGWPDDWGKLKTGGSWEAENGNHFLRLAAKVPGKTILLYRPIDLATGVAALELSWRQRITDLKPGKEPYFDARIMLEFKDAAGKKLSHKPSPPYSRSNTTGWVERRVQFLVPQEALTLEFMPALFQVQRGTFDLDDIVLKPTAPAPLLAAAAAAAEAKRLATVAPEAPMRAKWPQELHVAGRQILDSDGKPVWLQGVNIVSLEWSVTGEQVLKAALVAVDD
jgi:hypothetical protein